MSETLDNVNAEAGKRPTFLTVLCILTFIGSVLGVLAGVFGLIGVSFLASFSAAAGGSMLWGVVGLLSSALCLVGAIQMWGLKKSGFMLYLAGCVVSIIVAISSALSTISAMNAVPEGTGEYAAEMNAAMSSASSVVTGAIWTSVAISVVITLVFVLMYNANRKYLTK